MADTPHYLRFARALALVSTVGGATAGCYAVHERPGDAPDAAGSDAARADAAMPDTGPPDTGDRCDQCSCYGSSPLPDCYTLDYYECCAVIGPLAPPDLPV